MTVRHAKCYCGAVQFTVAGKPEAVGAFTFWKPRALKVTKGPEHIGTFNRTPKGSRKWCTLCGGYLYADHRGMGLTDVFAAIPMLAME